MKAYIKVSDKTLLFFSIRDTSIFLKYRFVVSTHELASSVNNLSVFPLKPI